MAYDDVDYSPVEANRSKSCLCGVRKCVCIGCSIVFLGLLLAFLGLFLYLFITLGHVPFHASCQVTWSVNESCTAINQGLVQQIDAWGMEHDCGTGQRCLYQLTANNDSSLTGNHTTPIKRYVDDISYKFLEQGPDACQIKGYSTSQVWYAILDKGTNYCNIHNLMYGPVIASLNITIEENTSNSVCTQYSARNCDKY